MKHISYVLIIVIITIFAFSSSARAVTWKNANQFTVAWDAVTTLSNGDPIPEEDSISYKVFIAPDENKEEKIEVGDTAQTEYTVTLPQEGKFLVGAKTIRKNAEGDKISESVIGWSDDPNIVATDEFGFLYYYSPEVITGLRN